MNDRPDKLREDLDILIEVVEQLIIAQLNATPGDDALRATTERLRAIRPATRRRK